MSTIHPHPDADQLNAFVENALPPHEREQTLAHLATCPHCRNIVDLSLPLEEETLPQPKLVRKPWFAGWRLALPGAIAVPVLTVLLVIALHSRKAPENIAVARPQPIPQSTSRAANEPSSQPPDESRSVAKTKTPAPLVRGQSVENLPVEGRNVAPPPTPQVSAINGGVVNGRLQSAPSIAADQASGSAQGQAPSPAKAAPMMRLRQTESVIALAPLPSNLPIASTAANGARMLALDTQNALFRSEDAGQHWAPVAAPWTGRAVRVGLAMSVSRRTVVPPPSAPARAPLPSAAPVPTTEAKVYSYVAGTAVGPASLSGTVTDPTGATISGATVSIGDRTVKTDLTGHYAFPSLPAGSYTVLVSAPGFAYLTRTVTLIQGSPTVATLKLSLGSASETVQVSAANNAVELISTPSAGPASPALFELTTESGEHWTSPDGQTWARR